MSEDVIIVAVDAGKPESLEEEIAREHGLAITRRLVMSTIGLRIVSFRAGDPSRLTDILKRLRADDRVNSAQINVAYRPVDPVAPETRITSADPPVRPSHDHRNTRKVTQPPRSPSRTNLSTQVAANRIMAADVLAGGL